MKGAIAGAGTTWPAWPCAVLLAVAVVSPGCALAGGISLYEVGTADVGLAAAGYAARAQDAGTVLTNPAGMTRLEGRQVVLGAQALYGDVGFRIGPETSAALGGGGGGNPIKLFPGGGLFYTQRMSPSITVGIAVTGNFGSAVEYDDDWVGRYYVQEGTLLGVSILPSIAWRVDERLSLGASLNAMRGVLDKRVAVNNITGPDGRLEIDDEVWGFGVNLGLLYEPRPGTRFGVTYTSPVDLDFRGQARFSGIAPAVQALLSARGLLDADVDLGVTVPQGVMASFAHEIDARWTVLGNVGWQEWSRFGYVDVGIDSNDPVSLTTSLDFKDTWHGALGVQYRHSDAWTFNAGAAYDSRFQNSDRVALALPTNAALRFGLGARKTESSTFRWGASFLYLRQGDLDVDVRARLPVVVGGRGDVVGTFGDTNYYFLSFYIDRSF